MSHFIYVTIGREDLAIPIANKVSVKIESDEDSIIKIAKQVRKDLCGSKNPCMFTWAIFIRPESIIPVEHSSNWNLNTMVNADIRIGYR